jgi:hypothetical protein
MWFRKLTVSVGSSLGPGQGNGAAVPDSLETEEGP